MLALGCWHLPEMCKAQPKLLPIPRWGDVVFAPLLPSWCTGISRNPRLSVCLLLTPNPRPFSEAFTIATRQRCH